MTRHKSFKRLVRSRMDKTGESYTAARAILLGAVPSPASEPIPSPAATRAAGADRVLATSDEAIRQRTGLGWEEWFDLLDEWGAAERTHREIAREVAGRLGVHPLAWNAQAVAGSYERARRGREVGRREDGFAITASRTVGVPAARLHRAFADPAERERWLPGAGLTVRTATPPRTARFDTPDGTSRVHVTIDARGERVAAVAVEHARLADAAAAEKAKAYWRERLTALKAALERETADA
ncbi:MAG TPA: hypothetical protein VF109_08650 [Mycobacteriales bacterium]